MRALPPQSPETSNTREPCDGAKMDRSITSMRRNTKFVADWHLYLDQRPGDHISRSQCSPSRWICKKLHRYFLRQAGHGAFSCVTFSWLIGYRFAAATHALRPSLRAATA